MIRSSKTPLPGVAYFLGSLSLLLFGWIAEANHWASATDAPLVFGLITGAVVCDVLGLRLIHKGPPVRLNTYIPGLAWVLGSGLLLLLQRLAEIKHWVSPASLSDFWFSLGVVVSAPACAALGLILIIKGPLGMWKVLFGGIAAIVVLLVSGYCVLGLIGILM